MSLLDIRNLSIYSRDNPDDRLVDRISLTLNEGEIVALVGESGSGKSLVAQAITGQLNDDWQLSAERIAFDDIDLLHIEHDQHRLLLGSQIAMIFQDPSRCLDPIARVGEQILESLPDERPWWRPHRRERRQQLISALHQVGIRDHERLINAFPHELSSGLCQKAMIAMAIARKPRLLIADEPTTGMEPGTQGQILRLLAKLNQLNKMSLLLLSHDIHTASRLANRIAVVYCGQVVEGGSRDALSTAPFHPYTDALLRAVPDAREPPRSPLAELRGGMPRRDNLPIGCRLGPRCPYARRECVVMPELVRAKERSYRCHFPLNQRPIAEDDEA